MTDYSKPDPELNALAKQIQRQERLKAAHDMYSPETPIDLNSERLVPRWTPYELKGKVSAKNYVLQGTFSEGVSIITGHSGIGKTCMVIRLCLIVTKMLEHKEATLFGAKRLVANLRRKVIYFAEDVRQVDEILSMYCDKHAIDFEELKQWFIVIPAEKLPYHSWRNHYPELGLSHINWQVNESLRKEFARYGFSQTNFSSKEEICEVASQLFGSPISLPFTVGTEVMDAVLVRPLAVLDTQSANIDVENENDNALLSKVISSFKTMFDLDQLNFWLVSHVSKSEKVLSITSARGASAIVDDAHSVWGFSIKWIKNEKGEEVPICVLENLKARFNPLAKEFVASYQWHEYAAIDILGLEQTEHIGEVLIDDMDSYVKRNFIAERDHSQADAKDKESRKQRLQEQKEAKDRELLIKQANEVFQKLLAKWSGTSRPTLWMQKGRGKPNPETFANLGGANIYQITTEDINFAIRKERKLEILAAIRNLDGWQSVLQGTLTVFFYPTPQLDEVPILKF